MKRSFLVLIAMVFSITGNSQAKNNVDSILDRLENRLMNSEKDFIGIPMLKKDARSNSKDDALTTRSTKINGSITEVEEIRDLASAIADLDNKIDRLNSDVQNAKQKVMERSRLDNYISMQALVKDSDLVAIKYLTVKVDGIEVYSLENKAGIWLPQENLSLYSGPLRPGNHRIDIDIKMAMKFNEKMPLNGDVYRYVNKSLDLAVPNHTFRRDVVFKVIPPKSMNDQAKIEISKNTRR